MQHCCQKKKKKYQNCTFLPSTDAVHLYVSYFHISISADTLLHSVTHIRPDFHVGGWWCRDILEAWLPSMTPPDDTLWSWRRCSCPVWVKWVSWQRGLFHLYFLSTRSKGQISHYRDYWAPQTPSSRLEPHYWENHKVVFLIEADISCKLIRVSTRGPLSGLIATGMIFFFHQSSD